VVSGQWVSTLEKKFPGYDFCIEIMVILLYIEAIINGAPVSYFAFHCTLPTFMPHKKFVLAYCNGTLGCLINTRKALAILLVHKIRDSRFRLFLLKWIAALVLILGIAIRGSNLMPILLAWGLISATILLCAFLFWFSSEDLFLKFVLEDEGFYNLAIQSRALNVFDDTEFVHPRPTKKASVRKGAMSLRNFESALTPQEGLQTVDRVNHSSSSMRHPSRSRPTSNHTQTQR
jgi:hypothetical protein